MKYLIFLIFIICPISIFAQIGGVQQDPIPNSEESKEHTYISSIGGFEFKIGGGLFLPQGRLSEYVGPSPMVNFNFSIFQFSNKSVDGVLQFVAPQQQSRFGYARITDTLDVKSKMIVNYFFRFKKSIVENRPTQLNLALGVGGSSITTDARNPFYSGEEGESKYEFVSSFLLIPGVEIVHEFAKSARFTLGLDVQITSYKMEGALRENIGGVALIPRLSYTF